MHTHIWITEEPHGDKIPRMVSFLTLGTVGEGPDGGRISQMVSVTLCAVKFRRETKSPSCSMLSNLPLCPDHCKQARVHVMRNSLKIATKCCLYLGIFSCVKVTFFARFSLSDSRCMTDAITSTKLELTGEIFWDSRCCLCAWVSAF